MMQARSQQGAVNIMVLIMAIVVGLVGWGLWYGQLSDNEQLQADTADADRVAETEKAKVVKLKGAWTRLAGVAGGVAGSLPEPKDLEIESIEDYYGLVDPMLDPIKQKIVEYRSLFGGDESTHDTLIEIGIPADARLGEKDTEIGQLKQDLTDARQGKQTAEQANVTIASQHSTEIETKVQEMTQARERAASQLQQQEDEYKRAASERDKIREDLETAAATHRKALAEATDKLEAMDREVALFKSVERIKRNRNNTDGNVIAVDARTGQCWIDIGAQDLLRRGTRFRCYGLAKGSVREDHGYIVVHDVEAKRALCTIENGARPRADDQLVNPHYDKESPKVFYFLGKLPGRYNNQTAQRILKDFGAVVTDKCSIHVDFLVLGDNPDPEAEVGPDADLNWFKQTTEYNDALRWGIETIRARDLETFLQF